MIIEDYIIDKSNKLSIDIVEIHKLLSKKRKASYLSKKLLNCGSGIGLYIQKATDKKLPKSSEAELKKAYTRAIETKYWLKLLVTTSYLETTTGQKLYNQLTELLDYFSELLTEPN